MSVQLTIGENDQYGNLPQEVDASTDNKIDENEFKTRASLGPAKLNWKSLTSTGEGEMARNRLVISILILSYFLFEWTINGHYLFTPIITITSFAVFALAITLHIMSFPKANYMRRKLAILADIGTLSFGLYIGGEITACTWPVYLWVIYGNGFRFGERYLGISTVVATSFFLVVITTTPFWLEFHNLAYGLLVGLIVLPIYARKLIKDLSEARKNAEEANKTKSLFLASVSHELRTPLNAIVGLSECLTNTKLNNDQSEMLGTIYRSGQTLSHLIENILDFSRLESGAMPVNKKHVNLPELLAEICAVAKTQANSKGIAFNIHTEVGIPRGIVTDPLKLKQILNNFTSNALKFTEVGYVSLVVSSKELECGAQVLRFTVHDTGIGISKDAQTRIFEQFTQADEKVLDQYGGTGLGLAIVKQTVELLGGNIGVRSAPGRGSSFWCEIPASLEENSFSVKSERALSEQWLVSENNAAVVAEKFKKNSPLTFLKNISEISSHPIDQKFDERGTILFTDVEHLKTTLAWLKRHPEHHVHLVCLTNNEDAVSYRNLVQNYAIASIPIQQIGESYHNSKSWVEEFCENKRQKVSEVNSGIVPASVLIAEDNVANQMVIRKIMKNAGHKFTIVNDGEGVMEALSDQMFDVILLDLNMPNMNGFDTIKFIRFALHNEDTPVIAVTADATEETAQKCQDASFDAVITKPYRAQSLLTTINQFVRANQQEVSTSVGEQKYEGNLSPMGYATTYEGADNDDVVSTKQIQEIEEIGGSELVESVGQIFLSECFIKINEIELQTRASNWVEVGRTAHALKSAALNLGANQVVRICRELEDTAVGDGDRISVTVQKLKNAVEKYRESLFKHYSISFADEPQLNRALYP